MVSNRSKSNEPYTKRLAQMPKTTRKKIDLVDYLSSKPAVDNISLNDSKISIKVNYEDVKIK